MGKQRREFLWNQGEAFTGEQTASVKGLESEEDIKEQQDPCVSGHGLWVGKWERMASFYPHTLTTTTVGSSDLA